MHINLDTERCLSSKITNVADGNLDMILTAGNGIDMRDIISTTVCQIELISNVPVQSKTLSNTIAF